MTKFQSIRQTSSLPTVRRPAGVAAAAAMMLALGACGGGSSGDAATSGSTGTLRLALTDAPSCGYDSVKVTVQKVRVHQSSTAGEGDGGWSEVDLAEPKQFDLLTLTNGVLEELGQTALPAGKYTQLRLVLAPNSGSGANPLANSVTPTGGTETALTTPSGQQSGLKTNIDIDIAADQVADFALDFDVCKSIVKRGNSGNYNLKPVLTMLPRLSDAGQRVVGYVGTELDPATTTISLQVNGVPVRTTPPMGALDSVPGMFVLYPVPAGNYDLVVNSNGRVTALVTGVPVVPTAYTYVNSTTTRIVPPLATVVRNASGTVTVSPDVTSIEATARVLKAYAGGPTVEVAAKPVDGDTGAFSFELSADAPLRAAYVAPVVPAVPLVFSADPATPTGRYLLSVNSGLLVKPPVDIDLTTAPAVLSPITLP